MVSDNDCNYHWQKVEETITAINNIPHLKNYHYYCYENCEVKKYIIQKILFETESFLTKLNKICWNQINPVFQLIVVYSTNNYLVEIDSTYDADSEKKYP